ncbi:hypothetical protein GmHk_01G001164 [Glycine max]|nr:hypothetical protein GmHk_01G001164 [Glycine max]
MERLTNVENRNLISGPNNLLCCARYYDVSAIVAARGGLEPSKGVSRLRPDHILTIGEKERLQGMFYHGPAVGTKCTYQNSELTHVKMDVA